jgi:hypothetical protein
VRTIRAADGEVGRVAGEPAGDHGAGQRRLQRCLFGAALEHPADQTDVDRFGCQRPPTRCLDSLRTPFLDQSQQGVDLAHVRPRQRDVQQRRGVDADRLTVAGGHPSQAVKVAHRIDGLVRWQVVAIGRASPRTLAGMDLDELPASEDPYQRAVGANVDMAADQVPWHQVERLGDFDVMIAVHLRGGVGRHVVTPRRRRQQAWLFLDSEHLGRTGLGGATDPQPGPFPTPHHTSPRRWASARSMNVSPAKNELRTNGTVRSTRGLSCGRRTRANRLRRPLEGRRSTSGRRVQELCGRDDTGGRGFRVGRPRDHRHKPILPLLVRGSAFSGRWHLQYEDLTGGEMPIGRWLAGATRTMLGSGDR